MLQAINALALDKEQQPILIFGNVSQEFPIRLTQVTMEIFETRHMRVNFHGELDYRDSRDNSATKGLQGTRVIFKNYQPYTGKADSADYIEIRSIMRRFRILMSVILHYVKNGENRTHFLKPEHGIVLFIENNVLKGTNGETRVEYITPVSAVDSWLADGLIEELD
ncbi:MAG: hypothetical protein WCT02_03195 [Candidatus Paceibacterota bacterium]